ncbi:MAG: PspC domain-containing protein [Candidatus Paceibacterota bacterium]
MSTKKLYKSKTNKVISGVVGGLGEYFDTDPVILRLGYLIIVIATGVIPGIFAYIIASMIVPEKPHHKEAGFTETPKN